MKTIQLFFALYLITSTTFIVSSDWNSFSNHRNKPLFYQAAPKTNTSTTAHYLTHILNTYRDYLEKSHAIINFRFSDPDNNTLLHKAETEEEIRTILYYAPRLALQPNNNRIFPYTMLLHNPNIPRNQVVDAFEKNTVNFSAENYDEMMQVIAHSQHQR